MQTCHKAGLDLRRQNQHSSSAFSPLSLPCNTDDRSLNRLSHCNPATSMSRTIHAETICAYYGGFPKGSPWERE